MKKIDFFWPGLPAFAAIYLKPQVENLKTLEDYVDYFNHCLVEAEATKNEAKKLCYKAVAGFLYNNATGRDLFSKQFKTI